MNIIDIKTVAFSYMISNLICLIVILIVWIQYRKRFVGIGFWLADFVFQSLSLLFLVLRGAIPDAVSMIGTSFFAVAGTVLVFIGLERFTGKRGFQIHNYFLLGLFLAVLLYFSVIVPDLNMRNISFSAALFVICLQGAWLLLFRVDIELKKISAAAGYVLILFAATSLFRIVFSIAVPAVNNYEDSGLYNTIVLLSYQMLFILFTFSLVLMVNRRLFREIKMDMMLREQRAIIINLRLVLWEYSTTHDVKELMQKALDEIEELTGSLIGFYHFVDEKKKGLTLQAWSTRTREKFCKAEGENMHYSLKDAGVWVDCVRERRPVIHNDYASLSHKKGLPPGHAEVIRELVVPIMRDRKVVSILGVGNKPVEYTQDDIELVEYIADLVWTIVVQKQADEKIKVLNTRLERLAMTDELTSLENRRAFLLQGEVELKRSNRYKQPLEMIMLDIDYFKNINDTFGHEAGDVVLRYVADVLRKNVRNADVVARLGGEEFGILLPNAQAAAAIVLAERLRAEIEQGTCEFHGKKMIVTISLGIAEHGEKSDDLHTLIRNADIAMYQAKREGRNRVAVFKNYPQPVE
ncbi:MAG: GGDEF domain-containing protein [Spirochaetales bacterium]|nr:GGDEF domain-containing protein [Spirochaetales bacterium]